MVCIRVHHFTHAVTLQCDGTDEHIYISILVFISYNWLNCTIISVFTHRSHHQ